MSESDTRQNTSAGEMRKGPHTVTEYFDKEKGRRALRKLAISLSSTASLLSDKDHAPSLRYLPLEE